MRCCRRRRAQDGYALLVILLALSVLVIGLAKAAVSWKTAVRREHEARMIDHAQQYVEAIKRYYHAYGHYPPSLDALLQEDGKGQRYLRQQFLDPLNSADGGKFQILHYGQSVPDEIVDQVPAAAASQGQQAGQLGGGLTGGRPAAGVPGLSSSSSASTSKANAPTSGFGSSGNGVGGGPIIGVVSMNKQPSVHAFNGFDTPDKWQFVYNYATDPSLRRGIPGAVPGLSPAPGAQPGGAKPPSGTGVGGTGIGGIGGQ